MKVLAIPDLHLPFQHPDAFAFLADVKRRYRPDKVVCLGDETDYHALSVHERDPDGMSAGDEHCAAVKALKKLYRLFPRVQSVTSNHTSRPFRQAYGFGIPKNFLRSYKEFLEAPKGWSWQDYVEIDGVRYEHGEPYSGANAAKKIAEANMQSTVIGHVHSFAGIQWAANDKHLVFGMNAGCLIDRHAYAFAYGRKIKAKPILGCGLIVDGVPTFLPMLLDRRGRWVGRVRS